MNRTNKKKSLFLAALLTAALAVGGVAFAVEGDAAAPQPQPPPAMNPAGPPPPPPATHPDGPKKHRHGLSPEMRQKVDKFMTESKPLRRELFAVETALKAQTRAAQPNNALILELAGKLFDLKDQLKTKAKESGVPPMLIKALTGRPDLGGHGHGRGHRGMKGHHGMGRPHGDCEGRHGH